MLIKEHLYEFVNRATETANWLIGARSAEIISISYISSDITIISYKA